MGTLDKLTTNIDNFFERSPNPSMERLAQLGANFINTASIANILEEALDNPRQLQRIADSSYDVSPNFLKLFIHRDPKTSWGLRVHVFKPKDKEPLNEPWHEHRWHLVSSILKGTLHSENGLVVHNSKDGGEPLTDGEMLYYSVPDKRVVGRIVPQLIGKVTLQEIFRLSLNEGATYAHRSDLAHHLTLLPEDGTTITSVITSPPTRSEAAFIESSPLQFKERESPQPLGNYTTVQAIKYILEELRNPTNNSRPVAEMKSQAPALLHIVNRSHVE